MQAATLSPSCEGIPPVQIWIEVRDLPSALSALDLLRELHNKQNHLHFPTETDHI